MNAERSPHEQLRAVTEHLDDTVSVVSADEARRRASAAPVPTPRTRARLVVAVAALVVVGLVAGTAVVATREDPSSVRVAGRVPELAPGECTALPAAPIVGRAAATAVWTGDEVVIWGGRDRNRSLADGAAYDVVRETWRVLPKAPIAPRYDHVAVWTGSEMVVWGGSNRVESFADGAAYDPASDTWRRIAAAPIPGAADSAHVWTGEELLIAGGRGDGGASTVTAAAYDPVKDRWRTLASPIADFGTRVDAVWTGDRALFLVGDPSRSVSGGSRSSVRVVAYDPGSDRWTPVPGVDLEPIPDGSGYLGPDTRFVWDGRDALVLAGSRFPSYAIDPVALEARPIASVGPDVPQWPESVWTGREVVFWMSGRATTYTPGTREWRVSVPPEIGDAMVVDEVVVWTGHALLAWGGQFHGNALVNRSTDQGVAYRPDGDGSGCAVRVEQADAVRHGAAPPRAEPGPRWRTVTNDAADVSMQIPPRWRNLVPVAGTDGLAEVLAAGTARRPRGSQPTRCPSEPLPRGTVFVSVAEVDEQNLDPDDFRMTMMSTTATERPDDFNLGGGGGGSCSTGVGRGRETVETASIRQWYFRDHGRLIAASVMLAPGATEADHDDAVTALNSLRVEDRPAGSAATPR